MLDFSASVALTMVLEVGGSSCTNQQPGLLAYVAMNVHPEVVGDGAESCPQHGSRTLPASPQPTLSALVRKRGVRNA